jgi:hypothetical protein
MINFEFSSTPGTQLLDQDGEPLLDQEGEPLFDQDAVMENLWEDEEMIAGTFLDIEFPLITVRYTNLDVDMYFNGNKYETKHFEVTRIQRASGLNVDKCQIRLSNTKWDLAAQFMRENTIGSPVTVYIGAIGADYRIVNLEQLFSGTLKGWNVGYTEAVITGASYMSEWAKHTLRVCQATCPWPIGGDECGYTGSGNCAQTYSRCKMLGNQTQFGGFVYLPKLQEEQIWWGRTPK